LPDSQNFLPLARTVILSTVKNKIYTAGYYGRDLDEFQATVEGLKAVVVDIRLVPQSRFTPQWRQKNLQAVFGENYLHVKELGNKGFKEKRIEIADLETGLEVVTQIKRNIVLLCACKDYEKCHRKVIAEELRIRGYKVRELNEST
jgi:uncharacterized protein (DUF488 family)